MMKKQILALAAISMPTPVWADQIIVACSDGKSITPMYVVKDDELGGSEYNMGPDDIRKYGEQFDNVMSITFHSETGLVGQFQKAARALNNRRGSCFASTDRELMLEAYRRAKANGYEPFELRSWRPTGDIVVRVEEWPD